MSPALTAATSRPALSLAPVSSAPCCCAARHTVQAPTVSISSTAERSILVTCRSSSRSPPVEHADRGQPPAARSASRSPRRPCPFRRYSLPIRAFVLMSAVKPTVRQGVPQGRWGGARCAAVAPLAKARPWARTRLLRPRRDRGEVYAHWEANGPVPARKAEAEPFTLVNPPPNVTAASTLATRSTTRSRTW